MPLILWPCKPQSFLFSYLLCRLLVNWPEGLLSASTGSRQHTQNEGGFHSLKTSKMIQAACSFILLLLNTQTHTTNQPTHTHTHRVAIIRTWALGPFAVDCSTFFSCFSLKSLQQSWTEQNGHKRWQQESK